MTRKKKKRLAVRDKELVAVDQPNETILQPQRLGKIEAEVESLRTKKMTTPLKRNQVRDPVVERSPQLVKSQPSLTVFRRGKKPSDTCPSKRRAKTTQTEVVEAAVAELVAAAEVVVEVPAAVVADPVGLAAEVADGLAVNVVARLVATAVAVVAEGVDNAGLMHKRIPLQSRSSKAFSPRNLSRIGSRMLRHPFMTLQSTT